VRWISSKRKEAKKNSTTSKEIKLSTKVISTKMIITTRNMSISRDKRKKENICIISMVMLVIM